MISQRQLFLNHVGQTSDEPLMLEIEKAEGVFLYEKDKSYLDLIAGVSVSNLGHGHPAVVQAVKDQADKYMHLMVYGEFIQSPQVEFASLLAKHIPDPLQSVYFINSGSEANEAAIKLAKRYTGRPNVVGFKHAYHGSTQGLMSLISDTEWTQNFRPLLPGITLLDYNQQEQLSQITTDTACVIVEAVQAEAGIILGDYDFMQALRQRCTETGALLLIDEVQTGFGRTGSLFAFEQYDIVPDMFTIAKGMGGGMPIGALVSSKEIMDSFTNNPVLGHITTFGGHPVSAAAAIASLKVLLAENIIDQVKAKEQLFRSLLQHKKIKSVRGRGLFLSIELESFDEVLALIKLGLKHGFVTDWFLFEDKRFRIAPPLVITESEIEEACSRIIKALNEL